jgi:hypothetical protein
MHGRKQRKQVLTCVLSLSSSSSSSCRHLPPTNNDPTSISVSRRLGIIRLPFRRCNGSKKSLELRTAMRSRAKKDRKSNDPYIRVALPLVIIIDRSTNFRVGRESGRRAAGERLESGWRAAGERLERR